MAAKDHINRDLFHYSDLPEEEFMKAPAIHIGTYAQAMKLASARHPLTDEQEADILEGFTTPEGVYEDRIHSTPLSEHAKIFPVTLTDKQANRVHHRFLHERDIRSSPSVYQSALGLEVTRNADSYSVITKALEAMNRNEIIKYVNNYEIPDDEYDESGPHSFLVPSPTINLSQMSQRALPMDYSRIVESDTTRDTKTDIFTRKWL